MKNPSPISLAILLALALGLQGCSRAAMQAMGLYHPAPPVRSGSAPARADAPPAVQQAEPTPPPVAPPPPPPGVAPPPLSAPRQSVEAVRADPPTKPDQPPPPSAAPRQPVRPASAVTAASGDGADGLADLRSRLEASPGLGPLTKREIANELEDFMAVARATNAGPPSPGARVALGERFTKLMNRIAGVLKDRDPDLARRLASDRAGLWARIGAAPQAASLP